MTPLTNQRLKTIPSRMGVQHRTIFQYLGISRATWTKIINGKRDLYAQEIIKLEYLGVRPEWLLGFSDKAFVTVKIWDYAHRRLEKYNRKVKRNEKK